MGFARVGCTSRQFSQDVAKGEGSGVTELKGWQTSLESLELLSVNEESYSTGQPTFSNQSWKGP